MTKKCPFSFNNPNYQEGMECIGEQCAFWVPEMEIPKEILNSPQIRVFETMFKAAGVENGVIKPHCIMLNSK